MGWVSIVLLGLFVLFGLFLSLLGLWNGYLWVRMKTLSPTRITDLRDGLVEIEGTVQDPLAETLTAPYTGRECVAFDHSAEYYHQRRERADTWKTIESGTEAVPFRISDATGTVEVRAERLTPMLDRADHTEQFEESSAASEETHTVLRSGRETGAGRVGPIDLPDSVPGASEPGTGLQKYRVTESRVEPGDDVYVLGPVTTDPEQCPSGMTAVAGPSAAGTRLSPFILSDRPEAAAERGRLGGTVAALLFGGVFTAVPGYVLLGLLGLV